MLCCAITNQWWHLGILWFGIICHAHAHSLIGLLNALQGFEELAVVGQGAKLI
jgi:hypothetical protein